MEEKFLEGTAGKSNRRLLTAAGCSLLLHAAVIGGWMCWESGRTGGTAADNPAADREIHVKIHPPVPSSEASVRTAVSSEEQSVLKEQAARTQSRAATAPAVSAQRVLDDPATGLIFSAYFKVVKARLARHAEITGSAPGGTVSVRFVLSRDGAVESVRVPDGTAESTLAMVRRLLDAAAPFPPFPASIHHASIAFDVLFRFDSNVLG